jgi:hypothetical protein
MTSPADRPLRPERPSPSGRGAPTARDVLGAPAVPPAALAARAVALRSLLRRARDAMAPPPLRILESALGLLDHAVLVALCRAGVPDALVEPCTVGDLAARTGADRDQLERLLRYGAPRGWVRLDRRGRVRPTRVTAFLRTDHPGGWRAWVDFAGGPEVVAATQALDPVVVEADPFSAANGAPFFEWMARHPERWRVFDDAMAAGARMHALTLAAALDWSATRAVCDVGGGTGALLAGLLDLVPSIERGVVLDLADVVAHCIDHPRLESSAGDAFEHVPPGFDTYLLVNVVHDWSDADAARILGSVAAATAGEARVIVVEGDRPARPRDDMALSADLLMAALTPGGRERDSTAMAALARRAGLRHERAVRLASGDLAHVLRRADQLSSSA